MPEQNETRRELFQKTALAAGAAAFLQTNASAADEAVWTPASGKPSPCMAFFPSGWRNERIKTSGAEINAVIGGSGPPVLMFHGAPDSVITWRIIAPDLAKEYTLVICDLRGYGDSSRPEDKPDHSSQSKRPMALDGVEVMQHLGYNQFRMVGHDRGGRVGRRMALDHPDKILKLATLDIIPAHYLYSHVNIDFVQTYFHWFNYLRAAPAPENELKMAADAQLANARNDAQKESLRHRTDIKMEHAMCEDYRASASVDLKIDEADIKAGKKIQCPLHVLWAAQNRVNKIYDTLAIWKEEGVNVTGKELPGGHTLQESAPKETLAELQAFLKG
jgi:haloacetate dehalogenase